MAEPESTEVERTIPRMPRPAATRGNSTAKPRRAAATEKPRRKARRARRRRRRSTSGDFMSTITELTALVKLARLLKRG